MMRSSLVLLAALGLCDMAAAQSSTPPTVQSQTVPTQSPAPPPGARGETQPPASLQYRAMDRNNDGLVSTGEFEDVARAMFDAMDADRDDSVSVAEMQAARQRIAGRVAISAGAAARRIRELDTNGDGVLSRTEHRDAAARLFRGADADSDGNLTSQEFEASYAQVIASLAA